MGVYQTIIEELYKIELKENIKILYCVEAGSRTWGFASPNSDYDIRFIYVRPIEDYLRLDRIVDTITLNIDDLDIVGWDIQKVLKLLNASNPTLFEWNSSPIIYRTTREWESISKIMDKYFSKKAAIHCYKNQAVSTYKRYLVGSTIKRKKYFEALRSILYCRYILDKGTLPSASFWDLAEKYLEENHLSYVKSLFKVKQKDPQLLKGSPKIDDITYINYYIEASLDEIEEKLNQVEDNLSKSSEELNNIFLSLLGIKRGIE